MKPSYESNNFNTQLTNLKTSLAFWDDLINKSSKLTSSMSVTMHCMSGFLEAFQKISDIAETNNAGLRPFGIALRRYCLRQKCVESRLRNFNNQITDCLVTPLSDRLDEWRRTANQMDRDCVKELRKAKSELQRAMLEAEKCKKRLRRKQERGGVTAAFEKDDFDAPNVQINFVQHDLACKQRALEHLEQRCLEAVAVEERRRFAELSTCLSPLLDAHLNVLAEMGSLVEALKEIQAAHSVIIVADAPASTGADATFRLRSTPLVKVGCSSSVSSSQTSVSTINSNCNLPLDPTIATGSAALSFAVAPAPSTLSITSTSTNETGGGCLFGHTESIATLHSPDADEVSRIHPQSSLPPHPTSAGLGCPGSPSAAESLLNGGGGSVAGGDALSLFDHNQSISGAPTIHSASSSSSLGLLPINCDTVPGLTSAVDSTSPNASSEVNADSGFIHASLLNNNPDEEEEEDGATTEGCLTEDDDNDETLEAAMPSQTSSSGTAANNKAVTSVAAAMEKSILYPNQALPPPVYTNISKLQAAAQRGVGGAPKSTSTHSRAETPPLGNSAHPFYDNQSEGRKLSQPTATISKGGMASLLRSLSISGRPGFVPSGPPPPSAPIGTGNCEGAGEGLSLSPPHTSSMTPVIADQALPHPPPPSAPNSPSATYAEARSRIDAIFSNVDGLPLRHGLTGCRAESPPPSTLVPVPGMEGTDVGGRAGGGNTSTFRRRRPQQQAQSQQRTAGINLMRGSMFQLNTAPISAETAAGVATSMDMDTGYGCGSKQTPMTPGPGRRAPLRTQLSTSNDTGNVIRPPRRSSSVCRELPSLCQQQPQQFHQSQNFFPTPNHLQQAEPQQQPSGNSHYAAPRGVQQHPQRVYADPRSIQHPQCHQIQQQPQQQQNVATGGSAITATTAAAAQLAVEAAAARRHQQHSSSGLRNPMTQRTMSPTQNGIPQSRLPQRQTVANTNSNIGVSARNKNTRPLYSQQQQPHTGIPSASGASYYGFSTPQFGHHQQLNNSQQNPNYQHQQQLHHDYPPPPVAFEDVESTSFIEPPPPSSR